MVEFEWNDAKSQSNQRKHGVSFVEAATVFQDEFARVVPDPDHSIDEQRYLLLGVSSMMRLLVVSHCERAVNSIRIISARKASLRELKQYEGFVHARKL
ncbi:MAG: BrnT family toxin [Pseudomonadota bacterium]|nr:BrnT family toxin [Pseudomonadota bacterium]MEC8695382.1 BrnT family toxin [Pseudomonadota bacterium]